MTTTEIRTTDSRDPAARRIEELEAKVRALVLETLEDGGEIVVARDGRTVFRAGRDDGRWHAMFVGTVQGDGA